MTTQQDCTIGLSVAETTYGTVVTPTRWVEFTEESLEWQPEFLNTEGLRYGARSPRAARRRVGRISGGGGITMEAASKGMGVFFQAVLGNSTSTATTAPAYQQLHTPTTTDPLNSYTIQKGIPPIGGGAVVPHTFPGSMCNDLTLSCSVGEYLMIETNWSSKTMSTATAFAAPSYPTGLEAFTYVDGKVVVGGTVTAPTASALATGGTTVGNIVDFSLKIDNQLNDGGYTLNNAGTRGRKQTVGSLAVTGSMTAEFDSTVMRDAYLAQTGLALLLTFQSPTPITGAVYPTIQAYCPAIFLEGDTPKANGGEDITQDIEFTALETSLPTVYIAYVTSDTSI